MKLVVTVHWYTEFAGSTDAEIPREQPPQRGSGSFWKDGRGGRCQPESLRLVLVGRMQFSWTRVEVHSTGTKGYGDATRRFFGSWCRRGSVDRLRQL